MGSYGHKLISATTVVFPSAAVIAVIEVKTGTATVTGKQNIEKKREYLTYDKWTAVPLAVGIHIVNLNEVTIVATELVVAFYGGE